MGPISLSPPEPNTPPPALPDDPTTPPHPSSSSSSQPLPVVPYRRYQYPVSIPDLLSKVEELGRDNHDLLSYCQGARTRLDEYRAYCDLLHYDAFQHAQHVKLSHDTKLIYLKANQVLTNQNREHHRVQQELLQTHRRLGKQARMAEEEVDRTMEHLERFREVMKGVEHERDDVRRELAEVRTELEICRSASTYALESTTDTLRDQHAQELKALRQVHTQQLKKEKRLTAKAKCDLKALRHKLQQRPVVTPPSVASPTKVPPEVGPFGSATKQVETVAPISNKSTHKRPRANPAQDSEPVVSKTHKPIADKAPKPTQDSECVASREHKPAGPVASKVEDASDPIASKAKAVTKPVPAKQVARPIVSKVVRTDPPQPVSAAPPPPPPRPTKKRKLSAYVLVPELKDLADSHTYVPIIKKRRFMACVEIPPYRLGTKV